MRRLSAVALIGFVLVNAVPPRAQSIAGWPGRGQRVADGVEYFTSTDRSLVGSAGPIAVFLLRLDAARVRLSSVHARDEVMGVETVDVIARRHRAVAAINGGFFNRKNGDPQFVLKEAGELVSDAAVVKGAVLIRSPARGRTDLAFDQLNARVTLRISVDGRDRIVPVSGLNTTRARGKLMLYNARYHADTDTARNGVEWTLRGSPLRVVSVRRDAGRSPIPKDGVVLSYGELEVPAPLDALAIGTIVNIDVTWTSLHGSPRKAIDAADDVVAGAGLLRVRGSAPANWERAESLSRERFLDMRHPRTLIGVDARGAIWLVAIDGRQPDYSIGMTFADLQRLCDRLQLTDALNLDGGGSTTMVVNDRIVNRPSDAAGPRPVSDALLVSPR